MNEVQRAAVARADAVIRPAMLRYNDWNRVVARVTQLADADLHDLRDLVDQLSSDDVRLVLAYARGLAAWGAPAQESPDAPSSAQGPAATEAGG